MSRSILRLWFAIFSASSVAACVESEPSLVESEPSEDAFASAAQALSSVVSDAELREVLKARLAERRTGDFEVMLADLADVRLSDGRVLGDVLAPSGVLEQALPVHVAAPLGLTAWRDDRAPLVTYVPAGNESELAELAYFRDGAPAGVRSADERPDEAVLVIALNERMQRPAIAEIPAEHAHGAEQLTGPGGEWKPVRVRSIILRDDKEPWAKGDPEIYFTCRIKDGGSFKLYLPGVDEEDRTYWPDKTLISWYLSYGDRIACAVMEEDGGDYGTLSVSYSGVTYKLPIHDDDDELGSVLINYWDPNYHRYYTGYSEFVLDWPTS